MATKISTCYRQYAIERMSINITDDSMYILLPSENDDQVYYRVDVVEDTLEPVKCGCKGFSRWGKCKHCTIVADAFAGYKPIVPAPDVEEDATPVAEDAPAAEPRITEIETDTWYQINANTAVYKVDGSEWIVSGSYPNAIQVIEAYLDKQSAVAAAEQIVAQSQDTLPTQDVVYQEEVSKITDISTKGALTRNTGFQLLKVS